VLLYIDWFAEVIGDNWDEKYNIHLSSKWILEAQLATHFMPALEEKWELFSFKKSILSDFLMY